MPLSEEDFTRRFLSDESFRARFKSDPKGSMREHGVEIPDEVEIAVVESTSTKHYVVLPPLMDAEDIPEDILSAVHAAGVPPTGLACMPSLMCPYQQTTIVACWHTPMQTSSCITATGC